MRAVVQRANSARCDVDGESIGEIERGLVVFVGIAEGDNGDDVEAMADKIVHMRIFEDDDGKMDKDVTEIDGEVLIIPNFTLYADVNKGRRPSFDDAASPDRARSLYQKLVERLGRSISTETGKFGAMMDVTVGNDGPVTIIVDT